MYLCFFNINNTRYIQNSNHIRRRRNNDICCKIHIKIYSFRFKQKFGFPFYHSTNKKFWICMCAIWIKCQITQNNYIVTVYGINYQMYTQVVIGKILLDMKYRYQNQYKICVVYLFFYGEDCLLLSFYLYKFVLSQRRWYLCFDT